MVIIVTYYLQLANYDYTVVSYNYL